MKGTIITTVAAAAVLAGTVLGASQADAWRQPYGGCKEAWQAPHSDGADACRRHDWTVHHRIVTDPHDTVRYSTLPSCEFEDGSGSSLPCSWNFGDDDGNGRGLAYWISGTWRHHRAHYVWPERHHNWVSASLADVLAESPYPDDAGSRNWEACRLNHRHVRCADGFEMRLR